VEGDESAEIEGVSGIKDAGPGEITFIANPKYLPMLSSTRASAVIVSHDVASCEKNLVRCDNPYLAFTQAIKLFAVEAPTPSGIHPSSVIGRGAALGEDVALHAGVVVEDGCKIGSRSVLYPGVFLGEEAEVGADCMIYPRVVIFHDVLVGNKVIIHSGAVLGSRPRPEKPSQNREIEGRAIIEDDVEIGAGVTIDCARSGTTIIGRGTKIDNLVHIGADTAVGCNCIIVSQATIGSGCKMGDGVTVAGQAGVADGVSVGDGAIIAAKAGVFDDIEANKLVSGSPAISHEKWLRITASMRRLPTIVRDIREFKKRLREMDNSIDSEPENH